MPVTADFRALRSSAAIATLVVGTLALAACSSGSAAPQTTGSSEDPIEITYIHRLPDGDGMTKVADLAAEWNAANPDIQVTTTKFDGGSAELFTKLETDVNAGSAACLAQLDYSEIPTAYVKGLTEDVSKYAEQYGRTWAHERRTPRPDEGGRAYHHSNPEDTGKSDEP